MGIFEIFKNLTPEEKAEKLAEKQAEDQQKKDLKESQKLDNDSPDQLNKGAFKKMIEEQKKKF